MSGSATRNVSARQVHLHNQLAARGDAPADYLQPPDDRPVSLAVQADLGADRREAGEPGVVETGGGQVEAERGRIARDAVVHVDGACIAAAGERQQQRRIR
jgi:hypothetical protein